MNRSYPSGLPYVPQRFPAKDCVIASLATVVDVTYEQMAEVLGITIDPVSRLPDVGPNGIQVFDVGFPLFRAGWSATLIVTREGWIHAGGGGRGPTSNELKPTLPGRLGTIGYTDPDVQVGDHELAWTGRVAIDCSDGTEISLENLTILSAILLTPLPSI
jgi:hypothetical protein